jgi:hypothetical protein
MHVSSQARWRCSKGQQGLDPTRGLDSSGVDLVGLCCRPTRPLLQVYTRRDVYTLASDLTHYLCSYPPRTSRPTLEPDDEHDVGPNSRV